MSIHLVPWSRQPSVDPSLACRWAAIGLLLALVGGPFGHLVTPVVQAGHAPDLVIRAGWIVDGSGRPGWRGDVAVRAGRIVAVGEVKERGLRELDATGLAIAPGFVDVHTHVESGLPERGTADNFLQGGVTTLVTGNCGGSATDLPAFFASLEKAGIAPNLASLVGHNTVRQAVMGMDRRDPSSQELARMQLLVDEAMRQGAVGLSTGLIYAPGTFSKTDEIVALAQVAARRGGLYATHLRSEGEAVLEAVAEALEVGRRARLRVEISHFKVAHLKLWGRSVETLALLEKARAEGVDVGVDQYPYTASATALSVLVPSWAMEGGLEALRHRLADSRTRERIAAEMKETIRIRNGREDLGYAVVARYAPDPAREGRSLKQIAEDAGRGHWLEAQIQTALEMLEQADASMVYFTMDESDVKRILAWPLTSVASDAGVVPPGEGKPHPRAYGTNARVLSRYVRDEAVLSLEDAIRRMTWLPASRFGLTDRGELRPGAFADLVVFDPRSIRDRASFEAPHQSPEGIRLVLVNGVLVVEDGRITGARPGRILRGPGFAGPGVSAAGRARS